MKHENDSLIRAIINELKADGCPPVVGVSAAAKFVNRSRDFIYNAIKCGLLRASRSPSSEGNGGLLIVRSDLARFIAGENEKK